MMNFAHTFLMAVIESTFDFCQLGRKKVGEGLGVAEHTIRNASSCYQSQRVDFPSSGLRIARSRSSIRPCGDVSSEERKAGGSTSCLNHAQFSNRPKRRCTNLHVRNFDSFFMRWSLRLFLDMMPVLEHHDLFVPS